MALNIPFTFQTQPGPIPLSQLDADFTAVANAFNSGSILTYPATTAETAVGATIVTSFYPPGNVLRYGTNTVPGTTPMDAAIQIALNQAGQATGVAAYAPGGNYLCTNALVASSNSVFHGDGGSTILTFTNGALSCLTGNGITNFTVYDLKINITGTSASALPSVFFANNSTYCKAERVEIVGSQYIAFLIQASSRCTVRNCYIHGAGTATGTADVAVLNDPGAVYGASYNIVDGNQCAGGGWFGVLFQQFSANTTTVTKNIAMGNRINGNNSAYGILCYNVFSAVDSFNELIGNYIENVQGTALSGSAGHGIYIQNQGGVIIKGNHCYNCCVLSSSSTLGPAGIGVNNNSSLSPCLIDGNVIYNPQNYYGIAVLSSSGGAIINDNSIIMQTGAPTVGIYIASSSNVILADNQVNVATSLVGSFGIQINAISNMSNISLNGNTVIGSSAGGILFTQSGGHSTSNIVVNNNNISGGGSAAIPLQLLAVANGTVSGNTCLATTVAALNVSGATAIRYTANYFNTTGANSVTLAGTNTGSAFNESNGWNGTLVNSGSGCNCRQLAAASPSTGTAQLGDVAYNTVGATPFAWLCTTAGTSGTWTGLTLP